MQSWRAHNFSLVHLWMKRLFGWLIDMQCPFFLAWGLCKNQERHSLLAATISSYFPQMPLVYKECEPCKTRCLLQISSLPEGFRWKMLQAGYVLGLPLWA